MSFNDFMNKIRYWDNLTAKWITRHFYLIFFEIVLVIIFLIWFVNMFHVIDAGYQMNEVSMQERILITQSINSTLMVILMIFNSFWVLFIFNSILKLRSLLRDINFNISKIRSQKQNQYKKRP